MSIKDNTFPSLFKCEAGSFIVIFMELGYGVMLTAGGPKDAVEKIKIQVLHRYSITFAMLDNSLYQLDSCASDS